MRAYLWFRMKDWLVRGAIPDDGRVARQLAAPSYHAARIES